MTTMIASSSSSSSKKQQLQEQQQQLYYEIEKWCQYHIHNGSAFLFEGHDIFVSTLKKKSDEIRSRGSGGDGVGSGGGGGGGRIETTSGDFQIQSPPLSSSSPWPLDSLHSFFCSLHTKHVKSAAYRLKTTISQYLDGYRNGQSIVAMAKQANIPPYLMCRQIVEHICDLRRKKEEEEEEEAIDGEENNNNNNNHNHNNITDGSTDTAGKKHKKNTINEEYNSKDYKKRLTMAMRNPIGVLNDRSMILTEFQDTEENWTTHSSITPNTTTDNTSITATTTRIAHEVATALEADALCGPTQDRSKHFVGIEFEVVLERQLTELGIPFEAEAHLRELGTSKTPDVVLYVYRHSSKYCFRFAFIAAAPAAAAAGYDLCSSLPRLSQPSIFCLLSLDRPFSDSQRFLLILDLSQWHFKSGQSGKL